MNVQLLADHVPLIISVPPLVILSASAPEKEEDTFTTLSVLVPPTGQTIEPIAVLPITRLPYAKLEAALSNVQAPLICRMSPMPGRDPEFHLVASLTLPGPVNNLVAPNALFPQNRKMKSSEKIFFILEKGLMRH